MKKDLTIRARYGGYGIGFEDVKEKRRTKKEVREMLEKQEEQKAKEEAESWEMYRN